VAAGSTIATSTVAAGATTCTVASGAPYAIGRTITFWRNASINGATVPECRVLSNVSGTTLTWVDALTAPNGTYQVGDAVGVGTYCKATTTRGAQMVVDLEDATITAQRIQLGVYRTHDGTTGVDKINRYLYWKTAAGATSDKVYGRVSVGKEHIYIDVEGPKAGETNAENSTFGSYRNYFALNDINPYFSNTYDAIPAVCMIGNPVTNPAANPNNVATGPLSRMVNISRDAQDKNSWVMGHLRTVAPMAGDTLNPDIRTYQPMGLDGNLVLLDYVVFEDQLGIRGSLTRFYNGDAASTSPTNPGDPAFWNAGMEQTQGGVTYRSLIPPKSGATSGNSNVSYGWGGFWQNLSNAQPGPVVFVPKA